MTDLKWWQRAVFYQIYPRSFADGNGDGIGDIQGMIQRLDYLQDLGVDAIWLSPHYPSPQVDWGYDVADYTDVAPEYGSLDDFRRFLDGLHQRGMRLILDLVLNHTSDRHPWFLESRSSRENPKRDWYVWRDGKNSGPPNNWNSTFGGPAWELDPRSGQYYYHFFFKEQPDLNWRNPQVKAAMWDSARFWLDLGVDGFRLDAIGTIYEDPTLPDHHCPRSQAQIYHALRTAKTAAEKKNAERLSASMYGAQINQPGMHALLQELRRMVDEYDDRVLVGETDDIRYYGDGTDELHMVFNFPLMKTERLTPAWVRANQKTRLAALPPRGWPCNTLGNHDSPRVLSRYGDGSHDAEIARLSLALVLTLRGTPFLYNGEEIGMANLLLGDIRQFKDPLGVWIYEMEQEALGASPQDALNYAARFSRDQCRTPLQWENAPNAGFSPPGVETWLPVHPNYAKGVNVATQEGHPDSMLHFYRRMLSLRKETPALLSGDYLPLHPESADTLAFLRRSPTQTCLVILNMSAREQEICFDLPGREVHLLFSSRNRSETEGANSQIKVAPFEIYIAELR